VTTGRNGISYPTDQKVAPRVRNIYLRQGEYVAMGVAEFVEAFSTL
jgi:hypothetical protein